MRLSEILKKDGWKKMGSDGGVIYKPSYMRLSILTHYKGGWTVLYGLEDKWRFKTLKEAYRFAVEDIIEELGIKEKTVIVGGTKCCSVDKKPRENKTMAKKSALNRVREKSREKLSDLKMYISDTVYDIIANTKGVEVGDFYFVRDVLMQELKKESNEKKGKVKK